MLTRTLLCLVAAWLLASCGQGHKASTQDISREEDDSLVILFTGDVLLDRGVRQEAGRRGWPWLFSGVESLFHSADATVINLECPLTQVSTPLGKRFIFRADTCTASVMRRAGITHATLANNHTNDQGFQGLSSTISSLRRAGITPMGWGDSPEQRLSPTLIQKGPITAALFCAVLFPLENWMPSETDTAPCQVDASRLAEAIRTYRSLHPSHRIICVLHWGIEFQPTATPQQIRQARTLISAGADAIIGHHPHVVQPRHPSDPIPVFYSLGNFVFDQRTPEATRATVARLTLRPDTLLATSIPIRIHRCRPLPDTRVGKSTSPSSPKPIPTPAGHDFYVHRR